MLEKWKIDEKENLYEFANYCAININVLESMKDWVRVVDRKGNILFMNKAMTLDTNIKALEYRCSFEEDIINGESLIPRSSSLATLLTKKTHTQEVVFMGRDYSVTSSPIYDDRNESFAAVEVFRDVSEEMAIRNELSMANEKMREDINFAKLIQNQLLPREKTINNLEIDYYYQASEQLSGDMFGLGRIDDDRVGIYISDVVGHGVSASLLTMFIKQNLSALLTEGYGPYPSALLKRLNSKFSELGLSTESYMTILYGFYSKKRGEFTFANAGHNSMPIIYRDGKVESYLTTGYPISELFQDQDYKEKTVKLKKDDILYLYTDGLTEIKNFKGEEFGENRLIATMLNKGNHIEDILEEVRNFSWESPDDDLALLQIKVN